MNQSISRNSTFLVSGGGKGITAECVIEMAQAYQCRFILLGRSRFESTEPAWAQGIEDGPTLKRQIMSHLASQNGTPTPQEVQRMFNQLQSQREIQATLTAIRQAGGQADYLSADITNGAQVRQRLATLTPQLGPITGVIHGAGTLADKRIEKKTVQDFERVFATKVKGLASLLAAVPPSQLTHLILFSSVAGFYGNVGQSDYAMANEVLSKAAHQLQQQYPACRVVAINWGPWDGGMVTAEIRRAFAEREVEVIPVPVGRQMLVNEMTQPHRAPQVVVGGGALSVPPSLSPTLQTYQIKRHLTDTANPVLADHRIGEHAVLPATCGLAWMAQSAEQLYPGYRCVRFADYRVLKGVVFDETLAQAYQLELQETAKSSEQLSFTGKISSHDAARNQPRHHYTVQLQMQAKPLAPMTENISLQRGQSVAGADLYTSKRLFHGPLFQGIETVLDLTPTSLTMACRLPRLTNQQQGQFPIGGFNPYLTDVMLQSMVVWVGQTQQASSLPLACEGGEQFRPLPFEQPFFVTMHVRQQSELNLVADVWSHDEQGQLYSRLQGAKVTISRQLNRLTGMT